MIFSRLRALAPALAVVLLCAFGTATADAKTPVRKGGKVRAAWPKGHAGKPSAALERWLARQVGPRRPRACVRLRRCRAPRAFARTAEVRTAAATTIPASGKVDPLALVRSYDIPLGDPSYDRLLNWSWTYDSAVTAAAFAASGDPAQAEQLLDQLKALQHKDGSIESAFNVYTGESSGQLRSGTVAWTGLAAATYEITRGNSRYDQVATDAADWLLAQRNLTAGSPTYGLVRGGPDASWYSTQHNLVTYLLLTKLAYDGSNGSKAKTYRDAANAMGDAIDRQLLVQTGSSAYFRQGYGDDVRPLDTQTLGAMYLITRGQIATAAKVRSYIDSTFAVSGRSIAKSAVAATFNDAFAAAGPFSGYRPYADATAPDVLWAEGTAQVRLLHAALFDSVSSLDATTKAWDKVSGSDGPLQADRTVTGSAFNEYHVWPSAAAGAWRILSGAPTDYFVIVH